MKPTNVEWIMAKGSDWTPDYLAWKYFRYQPWGFPLGVMEGYSHPQKVSIGLTGAIPLLAVPLKIFSGALPDDFQYHGFWLFLCVFLQGIFAFHLLKIWVKEDSYAFLGAMLFAFSYSMLDRLGHINLCAHWVIIAGLLVYFSKFQLKKTILYHSLLVFATIWIHPYLVLFSVALTGLTLIEGWWSKRFKFSQFAIGTLVTAGTAALSWWLIGNFILGGDDAVAGGFGEFSTNLNTFWNPKFDALVFNHSKDFYEGQYEGIAYLGIGVLLLLFSSIVGLLVKKIKVNYSKGLLLLGFISLLFFVFSLSQNITYGGELIFTIPFSKYLLAKFATLRASGRYVWLLQYFLILVAIIGFYKIKIDQNYKIGLLGLVVLLNLVDFQYYFERNKIFDLKFEPISNFNKAAFEKVIEAGNEVIMYPPHTRTYLSVCDETPFISIAASQKKPINTGHLARVDNKLREKYRQELESKIYSDPNSFADKTIITIPKFAEIFQPLIEKELFQIFEINNFLAYVPVSQIAVLEDLSKNAQRDSIPYKRESFNDFKIRNAEYNWVISVKDDARATLSSCTQWNEYFTSIGSQNPSLDFRESYLGLLQSGKLINEKFGRDNPNGKIEFDAELNGVDISAVSASMDHGNIASIKLNEVEHAIDDRGFNIVVFDQEGKVIESTFFDTFKQCHHYSEFGKKFFPVYKINSK